MDSFRHAMEQRKDNVCDRLWILVQDDETFLSNVPVCHRGCKSAYTHKKELQQLGIKKVKTNIPSTSSQTRFALDFKRNCFICEKSRDAKGQRNMFLVATHQRQESIHEKAKELNDDLMLSKIQGHGNDHKDMITANFCYHKSCMDSFMNRKRLSSHIPLHINYEESFEQLVEEINYKLFHKESVLFLSQLRDRYRQLLAGKGLDNASTYPSGKLKNHLLKYYGKSIQIISQYSKSSLVCSSKITVGKMCELATELKNELDDFQMQTESDESEKESFTDIDRTETDSFYLAKHLQSAMKSSAKIVKAATSSDNQVSGTVHNLELSYETVVKHIPSALYNFLAFLTTDAGPELGENGFVSLQQQKHEQVLNMAQDLMVNVTKLPMPNHIGLALHVLKHTRSKDLVTVLSRFGHVISYDDI